MLEWRPQTVVQVGVGMNHAEVDCMQEAWPNFKLYGFEPAPRIYQRIKPVYPGTLTNIAVGNHNGTGKLHVKSPHPDGSSSFEHEQRNPKNKYTVVDVETQKLDTLFGRYDLTEGVLLWLDCEGSEAAALRGAERFIACVSMVNVEMTGRPPSREWCHASEVHGWLTTHGFTRVWIHTTRVHHGQYDAIYVRNEMVDDSLRVW